MGGAQPVPGIPGRKRVTRVELILGEVWEGGDELPAQHPIEARGGKVLWMGRVDQTLIGPVDATWDAVALVQYPSRKDFIEMTTSKEYDSAHEHREDGLERTLLLACTPRAEFEIGT